MLIYIIVGIAVACLLVPLKWRSVRGPARVALWALAAIVAAALVYQFTARLSLGAEAWYDEGPWRIVFLYGVMLLGMLTSVLVSAIAERKSRLTKAKSEAERSAVLVHLDVYDLLYPFLFSFLTFGALYNLVEGRLLSMATLTLAYQNGFFWDSVIAKLKKGVTAHRG